MSAPDLAELRRIAGLTPSEICGIDRVRALDALPYLLAKVEAAERLAEACEVDSWNIVHAMNAYRKAGAK